MATFVLVHGAWQGKWCWYDVSPRLRAAGHDTIAPDLPGHGSDTTPLHTVRMQTYVDALMHAIAAARTRPILVGHSAGGMIGQVAEQAPEQLQAVIYITAIIPADGTPMFDVVQRADPDYLAQMVPSADGCTVELAPQAARRYLYPLCPPDRVEHAIARLTPEPVAPWKTPLCTTKDRAGRVPTSYVECLRDAVIPRAIQQEMQAHGHVSRVFSIDTDHSPFFSAPEELTRCLLAVADDTAMAAT